MGSYLLNATLVWLLSLVLYELFFRKETVHHWNRGYLLGTLLLGFVLPLISWGGNGDIESVPLRLSLYEVTAMKSVVTETAAGSSVPVIQAGADTRINWVLWGYLVGLAVSLGVLVSSAVWFYRLYRTGKRTEHAQSTLVETGKAHGPFSFFRTVFISRAADYTTEELSLVLQHEVRHGALLHSLDAVAMQLLKCVLWFHPLVHWYFRRLRLIHEYQADDPAAKDAAQYGRFLIEQAMLQPAPSFAHSFHQSPLKNRIAMLTRTRSKGARLTKYLLVIPLLTAVAVCCTRFEAASQRERKGNIIYFRGNQIELGGVPANTDGMNQKMIETMPLALRIDTIPVNLNGERIYYGKELSSPPVFTGNGTAAETVVDRVKSALAKLPNGKYWIAVDDIVIDAEGHVAYYNKPILLKSFGSIIKDPKTGKDVFMVGTVTLVDSTGKYPKPVPRSSIDSSLRQEIIMAVDAAIAEGLSFKPAMVNGKAVPATYNVLELSDDNDVVVMNGKITVKKSDMAIWNERWSSKKKKD